MRYGKPWGKTELTYRQGIDTWTGLYIFIRL